MTKRDNFRLLFMCAILTLAVFILVTKEISDEYKKFECEDQTCKKACEYAKLLEQENARLNSMINECEEKK